MGPFFVGILKLIAPWFTEWWKSLNMSTGSVRALREIHVMFILHVILFVFFLASVEHGVSYYVKQIHINNSARINEQNLEHLKREHDQLAVSYARLLDVLETFAREDPRSFNRALSIKDIEKMRKELQQHD